MGDMTMFRYRLPAILLLASAALPSAGLQAQPGSPARLDVATLAAPLEHWEQVGAGGDADSPRYAFYQTRGRPTFLLSWWDRETGPVPAGPDDVRRLVEERLIMTGTPGFVEVLLRPSMHRGHQAWELEGVRDGGTTRVRYRVWACAETERVFLSESRIALEVETDQTWLDLLDAAASSVACHGPIRPVEADTPMPFDLLVRLDEVQLGLRLPAGWSWGLMGGGAEVRSGTLWGIPTAGVGMVLVRRRDDRVGRLDDFASASLEMLAAVLGREGRSIQVLPGPLEQSGEEYRLTGEFTVRDPEWPWIEGTHLFHLAAFTARGEQHVLLVSRRGVREIDGVPVSPAPLEELVAGLLVRARGAYLP